MRTCNKCFKYILSVEQRMMCYRCGADICVDCYMTYKLFMCTVCSGWLKGIDVIDVVRKYDLDKNRTDECKDTE